MMLLDKSWKKMMKQLWAALAARKSEKMQLQPQCLFVLSDEKQSHIMRTKSPQKMKTIGQDRRWDKTENSLYILQCLENLSKHPGNEREKQFNLNFQIGMTDMKRQKKILKL